MDEEEDEDSVCPSFRDTVAPSVIVKSNTESKSQTVHPKIVQLLLLVIALLFSNFCGQLAHAQSTNQLLNVSSVYKTGGGDFSEYSEPLSERRIRHDTKVTANNKHLITFEPVAHSVLEHAHTRNTSNDYIRNEFSGNGFVLDGAEAHNDDDDDSELFDVVDNAGTPHWLGYNETCSCYGDKKSVSRAYHKLTISVQHRVLNASEGLIAGVVYQVIINSMKNVREVFLSSEDTSGVAVGVFLPSHKPCLKIVQFFNNKINDSQILLNWSLPTTASRNSLLSNIIFRLCYQLFDHNQTMTYEIFAEFPVSKDCKFRIHPQQGSVSSAELFDGSDSWSLLNCSIIFSSATNLSDSSRMEGLIVKLTRLNVRCDSGNITISFNSSTVLCGKLEEIAPSEREYYFPPLHSRPHLLLLGRPVFAIVYQSVDFCYNVSLTAPNDSVIISPLLKVFCNYKISLPYGYGLNVSFSIKSNMLPKSSLKDSTVDPNTSISNNHFSPVSVHRPDPPCTGIMLRYWDKNSSFAFCEPNAANPNNYHFEVNTDENQLRIRIVSVAESKAALYLKYEAVEITDIVDGCGFGSLTVNWFCVKVIDNVKLEWMQAENYCAQHGGHLASISDEQSQHIIDQFLLKSPSYQDYNSYWIGASDIGHEGEFRWTDSLPFSYSNWFVGWPLYGYFNKQPNDDGFSNQDCVELRRQYVSPTGVSANGSKVRLTSTFTWNDRDCHTRNYFLCEFLKVPLSAADPFSNVRKHECNQKISLSEDNDRVVISSPLFPHLYPDNKDCLIQLNAPSSYKIVVVFEEFVLENEPNCSYDYLEVYENATLNFTNGNVNGKRYCGDWSDKLKLLRYVTSGPKLYLRFISDYSHSFSGYKAHVSIELVKTECPDNRLQAFNSSCYLFVSYPQVTWQTAQDICKGIQGNLASVYSLGEEQFIVAKIRESHEYTTSAIYWLGGKFNIYDDWKWVDNSSIIFNAWSPMRTAMKQSKLNKNDACLGIQWIPSPSSVLPSGLYWVPVSCRKIGGYVCKIRNEGSKLKMNLNFTANGTDGELTSPNFPGNYYHNLDYWIRITGPENTRIIIHFFAFDLEDQKNCFYDYLEIYNATSNIDGKLLDSIRHCGHHQTHSLHRLNVVSSQNEVALRFHSDYSIAGSGFSATWKAVDISGCPIRTLTAKEGMVTSPNYPNFLLANLECTTTILAPVGRQVWFELTDWNFYKRQSLDENTISETDLYLLLSSKEKLYPLQDFAVLSDGVYLSYGEYMRIHLRTGDAPKGRGFKGIYKTISELKETRVINLRNNSVGNVYHLNFPLHPIPGLNFVQRFVAPLGYSIHIMFHRMVPSSLGVNGESVCQDHQKTGFIEVHDHYADRNGTWWQFCEMDDQDSANHLAISSYLNMITIKQISDSSKKGVLLNASLSVVLDPNYKSKIIQFPQDYMVESCIPNPCHNNGKCISHELSKRCECVDHFTGLFCALTLCDVNPCVFGECELTSEYFKCVCQPGYQGKLCDKKMKPCSTNPCEGRGECIEKNNFTFICQCHAWWQGEKCDKKIPNIPYKPLTDRMLEEPFWLGLLTVFVVLSIIGLVWCARRHFPEKLDKLLAEEAERNKHYTSSGRSGALRGDMAAQNGVATGVNISQSNTANSSPNPRTLLGKLGSQMSYKHRNGTSHRKKSLEKTLLKKKSSSVDECKLERSNKIESVELSDNIKSSYATGGSSNEKITEETSFIFPKIDKKTDYKADLNNKYEKKVHFARLMSRVQAEISAYSDVDVGLLKNEKSDCNEKPVAASTQTLNYFPKSPHSTSFNQGNDSFSSSEMTLTSASGEKLNSRRPSLLSLGNNGRCQKAASADSILAMFCKFPVSTGPSSECTSNLVSASTSPSASSPQDDITGSDNSSLSSYNVNIVPSSAKTESSLCANKLQSSTIQVSILHPMNSQTSITSVAPSNLLHPPTILLEVPNKCLSPIHEVPTPSPSPSMTPLMSRHAVASNNIKSSLQSTPDTKSDLKTSESCYASRDISSSNATLTSVHLCIPSMPSNSSGEDMSRKDKKLVPVIPICTVQEPSPIYKAPMIVLCPGTPPLESKDSLFSSKTGNKASSDYQNTPTITVTSTGDMDSDPDCPNGKCSGSSTNTMVYLSPFSGCSKTDRTASESNLSSSGYSSMASPSPSRCGSNNPLFPPENEDHLSVAHHSPRMPSPLLGTPSGSSTGEVSHADQQSDSEILSDDHQMESNDQFFSTDQLNDRIIQGAVKSAKDLELFVENENIKRRLDRNDSLDSEVGLFIAVPNRSRIKYSVGSDQCLNNFETTAVPQSSLNNQSLSSESIFSKGDKNGKTSLQPPLIKIDVDFCLNDTRSPVSSRSESPLSDRTAGLGRFSPMFYGRLTDSDGIYDWTSSDCLNPVHRKHFGRRRERLRSKSPNTKVKPSLPLLLDVPGKAVMPEKCRKPSPKRRPRSHLIKASSSSSSSSEATTFRSKHYPRRLQSSHQFRYSSKSSPYSTTEEVSGDDIMDDTRLSVHLKMSESVFGPKEDKSDELELPRNQRFSILKKLSAMLSQERKQPWKAMRRDSASIPLLNHPHQSAEEDCDLVFNFESPSKKQFSKHNDFYYKSSGLTE